MTRTELFNAIRPFALNGKFTDNHVKAIDALADLFGLAAVDGAEGAPDPELIAALKQDEGLRLTAYKDTVGIYTIGYGHAHVAPGTVWTQVQAEAALVEDVKVHSAKLLKALPWVTNLDPVRRRVLFNMSFNLGVDGLLGFKNTLEYVHTGQYAKAADGMLASLWAKQVKGRAVRLANEMRTGHA